MCKKNQKHVKKTVKCEKRRGCSTKSKVDFLKKKRSWTGEYPADAGGGGAKKSEKKGASPGALIQQINPDDTHFVLKIK